MHLFLIVLLSKKIMNIENISPFIKKVTFFRFYRNLNILLCCTFSFQIDVSNSSFVQFMYTFVSDVSNSSFVQFMYIFVSDVSNSSFVQFMYIFVSDVSNSSFVQFQIWDLPGHIDFFDPTFDSENIFGGCGALIFVIDAQVM